MPSPRTEDLPPPEAAPDRWRLVEQLGRPANLLDPYAGSNPLKGDRPIAGSDVFLGLTATSNSLLEARDLPSRARSSVPAADGASRAAMTAGGFLSQTLSIDAAVYAGDTVFKPPDWAFRFNPVFNDSVTLSDGRASSLGTLGLQNLSLERHLRDVSPRYDFDSLRLGIQPMTSDFRGFLLLDQPLALRLFGTRNDNRVQYNLAVFERLAKSPARLNDLSRPLPHNPALLADVYFQDQPIIGTTSELLLAYSHNRGPGTQQILRSTGVGPVQSVAHEYDVAYAGYSIDGHAGRLNLTGSVYDLWGSERQGTFSGVPMHVQALFVATELSVDFDWWRPRLSLLHASGDGNPYDRHAGAFDGFGSSSIFAGSDASDFIHQSLLLSGGAFSLKTRDTLLPSLRGATDPGQADFSNPGLDLVGLGADLSLTPRWTLNADVNQLWLDRTAVLQALLQNPGIPRTLGTELTLNALWRPFDTQNLVVRAAGSVLRAEPGFQQIYDGRFPYSTFLLVIFNW
jgi:hypothetical protein